MRAFKNHTINNIKNNPIQSKTDMQSLVQQLVRPLEKYFSEDNAYLHLGQTAAHYSEQVVGLEAFSRPLWGLGPLLAGGSSAPIWENYIEGMKNGLNPEHPSFWGYPGDFDQRTVETAAFGLTLTLQGSELLDSFDEKEKTHLQQWLSAVNPVNVPDNNWHLFKVMVNMGLKKSGLVYDEDTNEEVFAEIENYYLGDGWYSDGKTKQKDYYISFAIHYYCLVYATLMVEEDPERSTLYKERAATFANDFIYWFSADGSSIPFGRSMTYRFAQTSFWSALAFADVEAVPWGVVKGIVLRHLRWWMKQPIFTHDGVLTIGYGYSNMNMAESYNAPGSPYWSFKSFLVLALDESHPFWQAEEEPLPDLAEKKMLKHPQMLMTRDHLNKHVVALTSGQYASPFISHTEEKYAKFAYSNQFGFSITRAAIDLGHGAFDSMLALTEKDDAHWRVRQTCEKVDIHEDFIYSQWKPWDDVTIQTWLVPFGLWHVRIHHIKNARALDTAEGGFTIPKANNSGNDKELQFSQSLVGECSGIVDLFDTRELQMVSSAPNTNMIFPDAGEIPSLLTTLDAGEHWLAAAILAHKDESLFKQYWEEPPKLVEKDGVYRLIYKEQECIIKK